VTKLVGEMDEGRLVAHPVAVACFLRGTADALPRRWRHGVLTLDGRTLVWNRYLVKRRDTIRLPSQLDVEQLCDVRGADCLQIQAELFRIIVCQAASGRVKLAVPTVDVPLVRRAIQRDKETSDP
jgi:hypothetical protein